MAYPLQLGLFIWVLGARCNLNSTHFNAKLRYQHFLPLTLPPTKYYSITPNRTTPQQAGQLRFKGVSFRYSGHHLWFYKNLSLTIRPNKRTVIMDSSGCGRNTLTKFSLGFVHLQEGSIQLNGRDVRHLSTNELRNAFGVVPQEATLFAGIHEPLKNCHRLIKRKLGNTAWA